MIKTVKETQEAILRLQVGFLMLMLTFVCGSIGFYFIEDGVRSPVDAIYYTLVTISTVGYGDITPQTTEGKILSIFIRRQFMSVQGMQLLVQPEKRISSQTL